MIGLVRKIFFVCALALSISISAKADETASSVEQLWDKANTAYLKEDYVGARQLYMEIISRDVQSAALYYNLANAHYQCDELGESILYYYKAHKIDPSDENVKHNLELARAKIVDNIEQLPRLFIEEWSDVLSSSLSSTTWTIVSLVCFALLLSAIILYLLFNSLLWRRVGFFSGLIFLLLFVLTTRNAIHEREHLLDPNGAVVMSSSLVVRSSPLQSSTELFILHEGTRVELVERHNEWCEVKIADGKRGWVLRRDLGMI